MLKRLIVTAGWLLAAGGAAAAEPAADYAAHLSTLYGERYWIQAYKDVCIGVSPKSRRELQSAYEEWLARHEDVVADLELRFAAMVKGLSRNEAEYARNYDRAHRAVMQRREEDKAALRSRPREALAKQCAELPDFLKSAASDMYNTQPEAFGAVYGKKQP